MAMTAQDLESKIKEVHALAPVAITTDTTTNGEIIDTAGWRSLTFIPYAGVVTDGTYTPALKHSDSATMVGEVVVPDADLLPSGTGQEATAVVSATNGTSKIGYRGDKRYVTCDIVSASTSSGVAGFAVLAIQSGAVDEPIA